MQSLHFGTDLRFDIDETFNMCSQPMTCPSTSTSFSSASSTYDPITPISRRSTPHELSTLEFDGTYTGIHRVDLTPPATMSKFMFGPVKIESDHMPFPEVLPGTPMKREPMPFDYDHMIEMNMAQNASMGSLTPSNSFGMYAISPEAIGATSFMMTPTQSLYGSEAADTSSSWSCANDSPISFFPNEKQLSGELDVIELDRHSMSPYYFQDLTSPNRMRAERKMMVHGIQRKTNELQRVQVSKTRRRLVDKAQTPSVDVVRRAMCKCDYPGCHKAFRRNEHLKRHKKTFHGEGPNRFSCEFCGKDQFNRQDNLNNHRKLHARPNSRNRGVEFIPAAVPIIEQEERSRKRRAPRKNKSADKRAWSTKRIEI